MDSLLETAHTASTLFMVGVIWFVQVVHYPLFDDVGKTRFPEYEARHQRLTTWVVAPAMLIELATSFLLLGRDDREHGWPVWVGAGLLCLIWFSTWRWQVPAHRRLSEGFDERIHERLIATNWVRTIAWSDRGLIVLTTHTFSNHP